MVTSVLRNVKRVVRKVFEKMGYELVRLDQNRDRGALLVDIDDDTKRLAFEVGPYTMTSIVPLAALCNAVKYIVKNNVPGDFVECGVWKGGSMMAIAKTLLKEGVSNRDLYLFDTFRGMAHPTAKDINFRGENASSLLAQTAEAKETSRVWAVGRLDAVKTVMKNTGYDSHRVKFVEGKVEDTLPAHVPEQIALLRLDTDWYESTYHEMTHLYPRLSVGGVLIIDDYGFWQGARHAIDQYIAEKRPRLLLNRVDYTCRICVKLEA